MNVRFALAACFLLSAGTVPVHADSPYDLLSTAFVCENAPANPQGSPINLGQPPPPPVDEPILDPGCLPALPGLYVEGQSDDFVMDQEPQCGPAATTGDFEFIQDQWPYGYDGMKTSRGNHHVMTINICATPANNNGDRYVFWVFEHTVNAKDHLAHNKEKKYRADMLDLKPLDEGGSFMPFVDRAPDRMYSEGCSYNNPTVSLGVNAGGLQAGASWGVSRCHRTIYQDSWSGNHVRWYTRTHGGFMLGGVEVEHHSHSFTYGVLQKVPAGGLEAGVKWSFRTVYHTDWWWYYTEDQGTATVILGA